MNRVWTTGWSLLLVCPIIGCTFGRSSTDQLEARLRTQAQQTLELQTQLDAAQREAKSAQRELVALREQIDRPGGKILPAEYAQAVFRVHAIKLHPLLTGGLNERNSTGDDTLSVVLMPQDEQGDVVKAPGSASFRLVDPKLPEKQQLVAEWTFSAKETAELWTRSFWGTGYQFRLPLADGPAPRQAVLRAEFTTTDGRSFDTLQLLQLRGTPAKEAASPKSSSVRRLPLPTERIAKTQEFNADWESSAGLVPLPPDESTEPGPLNSRPGIRGQTKPGGTDAATIPRSADDPAGESRSPALKRPARSPLRDSTRWTESDIPTLR